MAKCDEGYICHICGLEVAGIVDSDLYLRYVIGQVHPEQLHVLEERHIRCNPALAQFIVDQRFQPPVTAEGGFAKTELDPAYVRQQEMLVTHGWQRLKALAGSELPITDYPLPDVVERWRAAANRGG